ncbi:hypothetical protein GOP80_07720 [Planococcaceae bacterium Storch 2/2-2]|nr:hypothetical protein [Planococcaceae bacterium Storch 2/2-2]
MSHTSHHREIDKLTNWDVLYTKMESFYVTLVSVPETSGGAARSFTEWLLKTWYEQQTGQSVEQAIRRNAALGDLLTPELARDVFHLTKKERQYGEHIRRQGNASLHEGVLLTPGEAKELASSVIALWNAFIRSVGTNSREAIVFQNFWNEVERDRHEHTMIMETIRSFDHASSLSEQLEAIVDDCTLETMDHVEAVREMVQRLERDQQTLSEAIVREQQAMQLTTMQKWQEQAKQIDAHAQLVRHQLEQLENERQRLDQVEQKIQRMEKTERGNHLAIRELREEVKQMAQGAEDSFQEVLHSIARQLGDMQALQMENSAKEQEREREWQHLVTQVEALDEKYEAYEVSASLKKGLDQNVEQLRYERDDKLERLEERMEETVRKMETFVKDGALHSEASAHLLAQGLERLLEEEKSRNQAQADAWNERHVWFEDQLDQLAQLTPRIESVEQSLTYLKRVDERRYEAWKQQLRDIPSRSYFIEQEQTLLAVTKTLAEIDEAVEALEKTADHQKRASDALAQEVEQLKEAQEAVADDAYDVRHTLQKVEQSVHSLEADRNKLDQLLANYRKEQHAIWEAFQTSERLLNRQSYQDLLRLIHEEKQLFDEQVAQWNEQATNWGTAHQETSERLQSLATHVQALEKRTSVLEERMEAVEEQLSEHDESLTDLGEQVQDVREEVDTLGQTVEDPLYDKDREAWEKQRKKEARPMVKAYHGELKDIWKQLKKDRTHASLVLAQSRIEHLLEQRETNELLAYDETIPAKTDELIVYVTHLEARYGDVMKAYEEEQKRLKEAEKRVNELEASSRSRNRSIAKAADAWRIRIADEETVLQTKLDRILFDRAPVLALMGKETNRLQKKLYAPLRQWEDTQKKRAARGPIWPIAVAATSFAVVGLTGGTLAWNAWTGDSNEPVPLVVEERAPSLALEEATPQVTEPKERVVEEAEKREVTEEDLALLGVPVATEGDDVKRRIASIRDSDIGKRATIEGNVTNVYHHKNGHLFLKVSDRSGTLDVVFFSSHFRVLPVIEEGDTIRVSGKVEEYKNKLEIIPTEKNDLQFVPSSF